MTGLKMQKTPRRAGFNGGVSRQRGLSLIELLVAIGLGLLLLAGIGTVYLGSRQTYRMQEANARVQETGRFALEVIGRSLRQAGADGDLVTLTTPQPGEEECLQRGASFYRADERPCVPVGAACQLNMNAQAPAGTTCGSVGGVCVPINRTCFALQGDNGAATDVIAMQFFAGAQGDRSCDGTNAAAGEVVTNVFSLNGNNLQCTSRIDQMGGGAVNPVAQPMVSEIEDLQVIYGIDADGNQAADIYSATPTNAQWPRVVTAKVCVMARSTEEGLARSGQRPLDCARALGTATGQPPVVNDTRLHRAFVATYNLRNRVSDVP